MGYNFDRACRSLSWLIENYTLEVALYWVDKIIFKAETIGAAIWQILHSSLDGHINICTGSSCNILPHVLESSYKLDTDLARERGQYLRALDWILKRCYVRKS